MLSVKQSALLVVALKKIWPLKQNMFLFIASNTIATANRFLLGKFKRLSRRLVSSFQRVLWTNSFAFSSQTLIVFYWLFSIRAVFSFFFILSAYFAIPPSSSSSLCNLFIFYFLMRRIQFKILFFKHNRSTKNCFLSFAFFGNYAKLS